MADPNNPCSLFVPSAVIGFMPVSNNAGMVINPPPPAMLSMKPANNPAIASSKIVLSKKFIRAVISNKVGLAYEFAKYDL